MPNYLPRLSRIIMVIALVLVTGLVIWWKVPSQQRQQSQSSSATAQNVFASTVSQTQSVQITEDESRAARITVNGVERLVGVNARGEYHRVVVPASANIIATVPFVDAKPGETIPVQAEDGGLLSGAAERGSVTVGQDHRVAVSFKVSTYDGLHRITLRRGGESRVLEFWVGNEPPVIVRK